MELKCSRNELYPFPYWLLCFTSRKASKWPCYNCRSTKSITIKNNKLFRFQAGQSVMMPGFATIPKWDNKRGGFNEQSLKNYWPYLHGLCSCWLRCTRSRHRRHVNLGDDDLVPDEQASGQIKLFFKQRLIRCLFWLPILRFRLVGWNLFARGAAGFSPQPNGHPPLNAGIGFVFHGCFVPSAIIA